MPDYKQTKIYCIEPICEHEEWERYIGSTTQSLVSRLIQHKYDTSTSRFLFQKYGFESCRIFLLEAFPCNNRDEQYLREGFHIQRMPCINIKSTIVLSQSVQTNTDTFSENKISTEIIQKPVKMPKITETYKSAQKALAERIRENRPNIAESSIKTYVSILSNLFYKAHERTEPIDLAFFKNEKRIMELLEERPPSVRKTILASIVVLNGKEHKHEMLEKQMKEDAEESDRITASQTKSQKQKDNWLDYAEVKQLQNTYELEAVKLLNGKGKLNNDEHELLTKFLILSMSSGVYFPPRRSEMITIKLAGVDKEKDNYIDLAKNEIVYNAYKTSKKYGEQRIEFPPAFKAILKKYLAKVKGQTYLLETNGKQMTAQQLTRELNAIFGKRISTSMLRHIYLSDLYKDIPKLNKMNEIAGEMAHSLEQSLRYVKH